MYKRLSKDSIEIYSRCGTCCYLTFTDPGRQPLEGYPDYLLKRALYSTFRQATSHVRLLGVLLGSIGYEL